MRVLACSCLALPVLVDLAGAPRTRPFGYVAADTFYYLGVARNIVENGVVSMDGVHPTNGFHPLWQLATALVYGACKLLGAAEHCVLAVVLVCLACATAALWWLGCTMERAGGRLPTLFVGVPFGVYALSVIHHWTIPFESLTAQGGPEGPLPLHGTLYSFVNGMESSLALLAFAWVAWTFVRHEPANDVRSGMLSGAALATLALARLDHAAFALFPCLVWLLQALQSRARRRFSLAAVLTFALPLALYAAVNQAYAGLVMPVSGSFKSIFPQLRSDTFVAAIELLKHPLKPQPLGTVFRVAAVVWPVLWMFGYLAVVGRLRLGARAFAFELRTGTTRFDLFLARMAPGVILLSVYDAFFVDILGVGHWYLPVSALYMSLSAVSAWAFVSRNWPPRPVLARASFAAGLAALVVLGFLEYQRQPRYHQRYADLFWRIGPKIKAGALLADARLIECDDGIVGFSLGRPAMARLVLDREADLAARAQHLVEVAVGRGYSAVATLAYADHNLTPRSSEAELRAWAARLVNEDIAAYRPSFLYGDGSLTIVRLEPRPP